MFLIYGLADPRTGQLRYVGKSCRGLVRARVHAHPSALRRDRSHCGNWIRSLLDQGPEYDIVVIQADLAPDILPAAEVFWISYFRGLGAPLTNLTAGGEGTPGRVVSPETREKIRRANLGNKNALGKRMTFTPEFRAGLADRARARSADPLIRAKVSKALAGQSRPSPSEATRRKISKALMGHPGNPGSGRPARRQEA